MVFNKDELGMTKHTLGLPHLLLPPPHGLGNNTDNGAGGGTHTHTHNSTCSYLPSLMMQDLASVPGGDIAATIDSNVFPSLIRPHHTHAYAHTQYTHTVHTHKQTLIRYIKGCAHT